MPVFSMKNFRRLFPISRQDFFVQRVTFNHSYKNMKYLSILLTLH